MNGRMIDEEKKGWNKNEMVSIVHSYSNTILSFDFFRSYNFVLCFLMNFNFNYEISHVKNA